MSTSTVLQTIRKLREEFKAILKAAWEVEHELMMFGPSPFLLWAQARRWAMEQCYEFLVDAERRVIGA